MNKWIPRLEKDRWGIPKNGKTKLTLRQFRCLNAVFKKDWKEYKKIPLDIRVFLGMTGLTEFNIDKYILTKLGKKVLFENKALILGKIT
jgi:hypothetical protein